MLHHTPNEHVVNFFFFLNFISFHKRMRNFTHACLNLSCTAPSLSSNTKGPFKKIDPEHFLSTQFLELKVNSVFAAQKVKPRTAAFAEHNLAKNYAQKFHSKQINQSS